MDTPGAGKQGKSRAKVVFEDFYPFLEVASAGKFKEVGEPKGFLVTLMGFPLFTRGVIRWEHATSHIEAIKT